MSENDNDKDDDKVENIPGGHSLDTITKNRKKAKRKECDAAWEEASKAYTVFHNAVVKAKTLDAEFVALDDDKKALDQIAKRIAI